MPTYQPPTRKRDLDLEGVGCQCTGLGIVHSPLALVRINGDQRLVVRPEAAIGTDILGLGMATALFFSTDSTPLKVLAGVGGLWMTVAGIVEIRKLILGPEKNLIEA